MLTDGKPNHISRQASAIGRTLSRRRRLLKVSCCLAAVATLIGCTLAMVNRPDPVDTTVEITHRHNPDATGDGERDSRRLRIVSYNVHGSSAGSLVPLFREHGELAQADVILLQEIEDYPDERSSEASQLAAALGMSYSYAPGYGLDGTGSHGVAILSRLPLSDVELIELPRHHVVVNSARRVALGATVHSSSQSLRVYSVHLDNRINPDDRRAQLAPVLARAVARSETAIVVGGDFNTSPFCWAGHLLPIPCDEQSNGLEELARENGFDTPAVMSGPTSKWLNMRLDGFYSRGVEAEDIAAQSDVCLSDHFPLRMDVSIGSGARTLSASDGRSRRYQGGSPTAPWRADADRASCEACW